MTATTDLSFREARADGQYWGRLVESAVGAHLANAEAAGRCTVYYWRDLGREVDFVVRQGKRLVAIEVKSGRRRDALPGLTAFMEAHHPHRTLLVGGDGIPPGALPVTARDPLDQAMSTSTESTVGLPDHRSA